MGPRGPPGPPGLPGNNGTNREPGLIEQQGDQGQLGLKGEKVQPCFIYTHVSQNSLQQLYILFNYPSQKKRSNFLISIMVDLKQKYIFIKKKTK